jgi:16S rRNA (uracil1498-N3)-methyltransferase
VPLPRFYAPDLDPSQKRVVLPGDESHHLVRVLRLSGGDRVVVFDGRGAQFIGRVERADRHAATVGLLDSMEAAPASRVPITLVQGVLKGDKMESVVRDATMAGVTRIAPVVTERSLVRIDTLSKSHARERWRRVAVSSAKQCGQARLPEIDQPLTFGEWLQQPAEETRLLLVEPSTGAGSATPLRRALEGARPASAACIVGPEGGWSATELRAATDAECRLVTLGSMTLRADAAGLVAVSLVSFALDDG